MYICTHKIGRLAQLVQSIPISSEVDGTRRLKKILGRLAQLVQSIPISSEVDGTRRLKKILGRLAQLVQSTSFTPRGSGVRTPHRPQKTSTEMLEFFYFRYGICSLYGSIVSRLAIIAHKKTPLEWSFFCDNLKFYFLIISFKTAFSE